MSSEVYFKLELKGGIVPPMDSKSVNGTSDPYVIFTLGKEKLKSKIIKGTCEPNWDETFIFKNFDPSTDILKVVVYDYDKFSRDDIIGYGELNFVTAKLHEGKRIEKGFSIRDVNGKSVMVCYNAHKDKQTGEEKRRYNKKPIPADSGGYWHIVGGTGCHLRCFMTPIGFGITEEELEKERLEKERLEKERLERERLKKEKLELERIEKERLEKERKEKEKLRLEQEKIEKERIEKERLLEQEERKKKEEEEEVPANVVVSQPVEEEEKKKKEKKKKEKKEKKKKGGEKKEKKKKKKKKKSESDSDSSDSDSD